MVPLTHDLTGAAVGYSAFRRKGGLVALWASIATFVFPDGEFFLTIISGEPYSRYCRGFTRSAIYWPSWYLFAALMIPPSLQPFQVLSPIEVRVKKPSMTVLRSADNAVEKRKIMGMDQSRFQDCEKA